MISLKTSLVVGLLVAGVCVGLWGRGEWYRAKALENAFARDSVEAALDTTRTFFIGELTAATRRAVQVTRENDSLDKALKRATVARASVRLAIRGLDTTLTAPPTDTTDDVRRASFEAYREPFKIRADIMIPRPPMFPRMQLGIQMDTARLHLRSQCGEKVRGVRPAHLLLAGPEWLSAVIDTSELTPLACNDQVFGRQHGAGYVAVRVGAGIGVIAAALKLLGVW